MGGQDRSPRRRRGVRRAATFVACGLLAAACTSSSASEPSTTTAPPTTSTTTTIATTTSQSTTTTTEAPIVPVTIDGVADPDLSTALASALTALRDPRADGPVPDELIAHHAAGVALDDDVVAESTIAELADGSRVATVTLDSGDLLVAADDVVAGDGWQLVGAAFHSLGLDPWFGPSPRRVLVLGSDARRGGDPLVHRMDSIHILTAVPAHRTGTILGYPRDSWIDSPYGSMRINALTSSGRGPDAIFEHFTETWDVPLEGYIVTGFAGFEDLVAAAFGRITLTIPIPIPTQEWFAGFRQGEQTLNPTRTLDFARTRKLIPGGDFTRSFHHGVVMLAVLTMMQEGSVHGLPPLIGELTRFTTTDLTATDLIQLGAAAMDMDIGSITNEVLPGSLGRAGGGASVVFLDPGYETIVDDVVDDGIRNDSGG